MSQIKQTNRTLIEKYASTAVTLFDGIEQKMQALVMQCVEVDYTGRNALEFKTTCARNAVEFANFCTDNMQRMSQEIQDASSHIAQQLGGDPINLEPPATAVQMPTINAEVDVERAAAGPMRTLISEAETLFSQIDDLLTEHLREFTALGVDGWIGEEYDLALDAVSRLTENASQGVTEYRSMLVNYIDAQLEAVHL